MNCISAPTSPSSSCASCDDDDDDDDDDEFVFLFMCRYIECNDVY